jgi:hypothetical protein
MLCVCLYHLGFVQFNLTTTRWLRRPVSLLISPLSLRVNKYLVLQFKHDCDDFLLQIDFGGVGDDDDCNVFANRVSFLVKGDES